jgi:hypothetical protein
VEVLEVQVNIFRRVQLVEGVRVVTKRALTRWQWQAIPSVLALVEALRVILGQILTSQVLQPADLLEAV